MGEAKRRKELIGEKYGQETRILPWVPVTKSQAEFFVKWANRLTWFGIGGLVVAWLTIRFIGPAFGWWQIVG
ncbi:MULTISPECIES: DUF2839 domain-containing protein [Nostocales]|uniref:DUF2839 domain-containing protein n=3 Tax=Nostocales TaxID=1161 RepID=A0A0C1MYU7_9CYAN|nr:DUF2839 domain-containing protein [Tolypothrix bouteillei]KAF3889029.1 DUF2839 domain-containing protein [Tolypothrix bouteillei VB521301]